MRLIKRERGNASVARKESKKVALMYELHLPNLFGVGNLRVIESLRLCEWQVRERAGSGADVS